MRRLIRALAVLACLAPVPPAVAACQIAASEVAFGVIDIARGSDSTGEVRLTCAIATSFQIALVGNGSPGNRYMTGASGGRLVYDLYPDASRSVPWGDGAGSGVMVPGNNDGSSTSRITVYGRVPAQSAVPAGVYSDSLTVVVSF